MRDDEKIARGKIYAEVLCYCRKLIGVGLGFWIHVIMTSKSKSNIGALINRIGFRGSLL